MMELPSPKVINLPTLSDLAYLAGISGSETMSGWWIAVDLCRVSYARFQSFKSKSRVSSNTSRKQLVAQNPKNVFCIWMIISF